MFLQPRIFFYGALFSFYVAPLFFYGSGTYLDNPNFTLISLILLSVVCFEAGYIRLIPSSSLRVPCNTPKTLRNGWAIGAAILCLFGLMLDLQTVFAAVLCVFYGRLFYEHHHRAKYRPLLACLVTLAAVILEGYASKTFVASTGILLVFYASFRLNKWALVGAGTISLLVLFYFSATLRQHPAILAGLSGWELLVDLILGRLNMVEPTLRILDDVAAYRSLYVDFPLSNTVFPLSIYEVLPGYRAAESPTAVIFGREFYSTTDTWVSTGVLGELYGAFTWLGALYFVLVGKAARLAHGYAQERPSTVSYALCLYFYVWVLFLGMETTLSLTISQFFQFALGLGVLTAVLPVNRAQRPSESA